MYVRIGAMTFLGCLVLSCFLFPSPALAGELDCSYATPLVLNGPSRSASPMSYPDNVLVYACACSGGGGDVVYSLTTPPGLGVQVRILLAGPDPGHVANIDLMLLGSCDKNDCVARSCSGSNRVEIIEVCLEPNRTYYVVVDGSDIYGGTVIASILKTCPNGNLPIASRVKQGVHAHDSSWSKVKQLFR